MKNVAESTSWSRADRNAVSVSPDFYGYIPASAAAWYESAEEIKAGLAYGRQKKILLAWVRQHMTKLSVSQQKYIELYYFEGLSYQEIADKEGVATSTACRTVLRGINKLRAAAGLPPSDPALRPGRKRVQSNLTVNIQPETED